MNIIKIIFLTLYTGFLYPGTGGTVSGFVVNADTGEELPGANVFLVGTEFGMATDKDGYFVIPGIPPGNYNMFVSYIGYTPLTHSLYLNDGDEIQDRFQLQPETVQFNAIQVSGEKMDQKMNIQMSRVKLNFRQLNSVPQLGEADLFRTLQSLPGILTESEFSTGLVIRGGNTDQNLILLDGITVYNPSHVGGVFSNFILDAIKEVDLLKGGFNAEYGGRLSAVLNVRSREGNSKYFSGKTSVSALSAQTTLEGPIKNGAWLVAGRRTYVDKVTQGMSNAGLIDFTLPYFFYDLQGHIFQDISEGERISLSWYSGMDNLEWDEFGLLTNWKNQTIAANYRKLFNTQLISNWMLAKSRFDIFFDLGSGGMVESDFIDDITFNNTWSYYASQKTRLIFGIELKELSFNYGVTWLDTVIFETQQKPLEGAVFLKTATWITPKFLVTPGIRLCYYENHPEKWYSDPRLNLKYLVTSDRHINASAGLYHQFMEAIQDDYYPKILDAWFAVDHSVDPASAFQFVLGYEEYFENTYRIQLETYYKKMYNLLTFVDTRSAVDELVSDENLDSLVEMGDGYAYGLEAFIQKEYGRWNGWISYSTSIARKIFEGNEYFTNWDRRHAFNIVGNYNLNDKWSFNFQWTYQTGQPYTPILGYYTETLPDAPELKYRTIPGGRNSVRYPNYHRLDLGAVRKIRWFGLDGELFFQVINAYWKENVFRYFYHFGNTHNGIDDDHNDQIDDPGEGIPQRVQINGFPIIPSIGVKFEF